MVYNRCVKNEKGVVMKGSIRFMLGVLLVFGSVGGMDTVPGVLLFQIATAAVGLVIMWSGVKAMERA